MLRILTLCCVLFAAGCSAQGEENMANLILDEQFTGTDAAHYQNKGWYDGVSQIGSGYKIEHDATLDKNVMVEPYINHSGADGGRFPDNVTAGLRHALPATNEITIHTMVKYKNLLATSGNMHHHVILRGAGKWTPPNSGGTTYIEPKRQNHEEQHIYGVSGTYKRVSRTFIFTWREPETSHVDMTNQNWMVDDKWYEIVVNVRSSSTNGKVHLMVREHGTDNWVTLANDEGFNMGGSDAAFNQYIIGAYVHNGHVPNQALYTGFIKVYDGDAVDTIMGGASTTPVDPPVVENPVTPDIPAPLPEITGIFAKAGVDSATVSWKTNVPSNAVMDYGITDRRGTIVRDNELSTDHVFNLTDLAPNTTYYYRMSAKDEAGNIKLVEENRTFTTGEEVVDTTPPPATKFVVELDAVPAAGQGLMYDGDKWVVIDLEDEVKRILEERTKLTVS